MEAQEFIPIHQLCTTYQIEISFFNELNEVGLIEITTFEEQQCLHQNNIADLEKMIRIVKEKNED